MRAGGLTVCEPDMAVEAVQPAAHDVALVVDHFTLEDWPAAIEAGVALNVRLVGSNP